MTTIGLFRADPAAKTLAEVGETDLAALGLRERYDLQEWSAKKPAVLGEDLLIIAKECNSFDATSERADLVAIDKDGNVVVIELKRDDSGTDMHWQSVKYASYFARAKPQVLVDLLAKHASLSAEEALKQILTFVETDDLASINRDQRIILASHRFAREVTSAVLWLRERSVDIACVQLTPYADADTKALYLQSTTIIPVPGTDKYAVTAASPPGAGAVTPGRGKKEDDATVFMRRIATEALGLVADALRPDKVSRWAGVWGTERYFNIWYKRPPWRGYSFQYRLHLYREGDKTILSAGFHVLDATALGSGLLSQQLAALKQDMKAFSSAQGQAFFDDPGVWSWCGTNLDAAVLDDALGQSATRVLTRLIDEFTPKVDGLINAANVKDA